MKLPLPAETQLRQLFFLPNTVTADGKARPASTEALLATETLLVLNPPNSWREVSVRVSVLEGWVGAHGHLFSPGTVPGTTREAGVWLKPPAVLSGASAPQPNTQGLW